MWTGGALIACGGLHRRRTLGVEASPQLCCSGRPVMLASARLEIHDQRPSIDHLGTEILAATNQAQTGARALDQLRESEGTPLATPAIAERARGAWARRGLG